MIIEAKLIAFLRPDLINYDKHLGENQWDIPEGTTVGEFISMLNVPHEMYKTILVNGGLVDSTKTLVEGDVMRIIGILSGG